MNEVGGISSNSRIYDGSGNIDSSKILEDVDYLIKTEGLADEAKNALGEFEVLLGPLKTQYNGLQARLDAGETLTSEETAWISQVQKLLSAIDTNMQLYQKDVGGGIIDSPARTSLISDIASLKGLAQAGPTGGASAIGGAGSVGSVQETYQKRLEGYQKTQTDLDGVLKRLEELQKQQASIGLTYDQVGQYFDLLAQKNTLVGQLKSDAEFFAANPAPSGTAGSSSDFNTWLAKQPSAETLKNTTGALLGRNDAVQKTYDSDPSRGSPTYAAAAAMSYYVEDPQALAAEAQTWMENIKSELNRMYGVMLERPLTADEHAYMGRLLERAGSVGEEVRGATLAWAGMDASVHVDMWVSDLDRVRDISSSGYIELASERNASVKDYQDLSTQADLLIEKLNNRTITPEESKQLGVLKDSMNGLLGKISNLDDQINQIKSSNPNARDYDNQILSSELHRMYGLQLARPLTAGEQVYLDMLVERAEKAGDALNYVEDLTKTGYMSLATERKELVESYPSLRQEFDGLNKKLQDGILTAEESQRLGSLTEQLDGLLARLDAIGDQITSLKASNNSVANYENSAVSSGSIKTLDTAAPEQAVFLSQKNQLVYKYDTLNKEFEELTAKLKNGTLKPEEAQRLESLSREINTTLDQVDAVDAKISAQSESSSLALDYYNQEVAAGHVKTLDTAQVRGDMRTTAAFLELYNGSLAVQAQQKIISGYMDRIKKGENLSDEDEVKLQAAIDAYNRLSTDLDTQLDNLLVTLQNQLPTPAADGSYTAEQRTQMLDTLLTASQVRGMMAESSVGNAKFLDSVSDTITTCGDKIAAGQPLDSSALGKLSSGINTYIKSKADRPLDLTGFEDLSEIILSRVEGYDEEIDLNQQIWDTFSARLDKANAQTELIVKTMQEGQEKLTAVTGKLSQIDALLTHEPPYTTAELTAKMTELGLDADSVNSLLSPPHTFAANPATDPKGFLEEAKSVLITQQDNLKTSNSQQLLLLQQAQNDAAAAAQALASFLEAWNKMMQAIIQKI